MKNSIFTSIRMTTKVRCIACVVVLAMTACAGPRLSRGVKWMDPDMNDIPKPRVEEEYAIWDFMDHSLFYPVGTLFNLEWTAQRLGGRLGIGQGKQADNLNSLDEVPNSSWFTNRHFLHPMSIDEMVEGPGSAQPDTSGPWSVVSGKTVGRTTGFTIMDPAGERFVIKFDVQTWPEMGSSAEAVSTLIFHAAGYSVPRNSVVFFSPSQLELSSEAWMRYPDGSERAMTRDDLDAILATVDPLPDGQLRCVSSAYLQGDLLGPPGFHGRRGDDPDDRVLHEHRRELRGMRVLSSWLHDTDRRTANMLDVYVKSEKGRR